MLQQIDSSNSGLLYPRHSFSLEFYQFSSDEGLFYFTLGEDNTHPTAKPIDDEINLTAFFRISAQTRSRLP